VNYSTSPGTSIDRKRGANLNAVIEMNKLIALIAIPIIWVLGLMVLGLILGLRQALVLYLFSITAVSDQLLYSIESQYRERAVNGPLRKPVIPPLWDGKAAKRIVDIIVKSI
jgi:hypothetical protein